MRNSKSRTGERLGQEQRLRMLLRHGGDHVLPETHRLGMRIVHTEDRHAGLNPQVHDAFDEVLKPTADLGFSGDGKLPVR